MEKDFAPYEESLELKELGFDEPCIATHGYLELYINTDDGHLKAPLYRQVFRFFREKYELEGFVEGRGYNDKKYYIYTINGKWHPSQPAFDTPEEAELACLRKLIEIVKTK